MVNLILILDSYTYKKKPYTYSLIFYKYIIISSILLSLFLIVNISYYYQIGDQSIKKHLESLYPWYFEHLRSIYHVLVEPIEKFPSSQQLNT